MKQRFYVKTIFFYEGQLPNNVVTHTYSVEVDMKDVSCFNDLEQKVIETLVKEHCGENCGYYEYRNALEAGLEHITQIIPTSVFHFNTEESENNEEVEISDEDF